MKERLTAKQIGEYKKFCHDRDRGRILTPDGLRFICASCKYDPESIGKHFLEILAKFQADKFKDS